MLKRKAASGDRRLLAWSAACSSGEEAYTMAMTLLESAPPIAGVRWDFRLLASDISTAMLAAARSGVYAPERLAPMPPALRGKYFERDSAGDFRVAPELQRMIRFRHLNLMDQWPFHGPFDFIFCRNVMIYFDKATQQK